MKFQDEYLDKIIGFYKGINRFKKESLNIDRDLKIKMLEDDLIVPDLKKIKWSSTLLKNRWWSVIEKNKSTSIITGSVALSAFGLLSRKPLNLDLIKVGNCIIPGDDLDMQYSTDNINDNLIMNRKHKSLIIHLFYHSKIETINYQGFTFHNPYQILRQKLKIFLDGGPTKHYLDIDDWINKKNTYQSL